MKKLSSTIVLLVMGMLLTFSSCEKDNEITSTHTDASALVGGTYSGTFIFDETTFPDAVIMVTRLDTAGLQAVSVNIQVPSFESLDVTAYLNVAVANDEFTFSSGNSTTQKMSGRISGNSFVLNVPLNKSGSKLSNASTGITGIFAGTKN